MQRCTVWRCQDRKQIFMKRVLYLVGMLSLLFSCKKEKENEETFCFDGVVRWAGEPAADGLGWVLYKDDSTTTKPYIPQNLPDEFKSNDLKVAACIYETDEKFYCFCIQPLSKYRITSIKRR